MIKRFTNFFSASLLSSIVAIGCLCGCDSDSKITTQRIPKSRSGLGELRFSRDQMPAAEAQATRMVVAMFGRDEATWFFKITGPEKSVSQHQQQWETFFETVSFKDDKPIWQLPDDWSQAANRPMRYKTFRIGGADSQVELAVSSLTANQDLLLNVNRWRGQLALDKLGSERELESNVRELKSATGDPYYLFDAVGTGAGTMAGLPRRGPFQSGNPGIANSPPTGRGNRATLQFAVPDGWTQGRSSSIVHTRLLKSDDNSKSPAQITVTRLPAAANSWLPNAKRWVGQVGLELSDEQLEQRTSTFKVDQHEGKLLDLIDLEADGSTGMIAGMFVRSDSAWFVKITGDKKLVDQSRAQFQQFIESLSFEANE